MFRHLFTIVSALSLLLCVGFGTLWACSPLGIEPYFGLTLPGNVRVGVVSGALCLDYLPYRDDPGVWSRHSVREITRIDWFYLFFREHRLGDVPGQPLVNWFLIIPPWFLVPGTAALPLLWSANRTARLLVHRYRLRLGLCLHCGYDLRASNDRCPECGSPTAHSKIEIQKSKIP